jgi:hypothetical protein
MPDGNGRRSRSLVLAAKLTSRNICASEGYGSAVTLENSLPDGFTTTVDAISFRGPDIHWITAYEGMLLNPRPYLKTNQLAGSCITPRPLTDPFILKGPFTFTYPTVYLAHHAITANPFNRAGMGYVNIPGLPATRSPGIIYTSFELYLSHGTSPSKFEFHGSPVRSIHS